MISKNLYVQLLIRVLILVAVALLLGWMIFQKKMYILSVIPVIAMGNRVIVVPSETSPLSATDLYQIIETSDVPGGVINIVTGKQDELVEVLAKHDDVDGLWYFGTKEGSKMVEYAAAENMKRTWVNFGKLHNWFDCQQGEVEQSLRNATQIKNIWIPYGA